MTIKIHFDVEFSLEDGERLFNQAKELELDDGAATPQEAIARGFRDYGLEFANMAWVGVKCTSYS
jgi:hypothetical protein